MIPGDVFEAIRHEPRLSPTELSLFLARDLSKTRRVVEYLLAGRYIRQTTVGGLFATHAGLIMWALSLRQPVTFPQLRYFFAEKGVDLEQPAISGALGVLTTRGAVSRLPPLEGSRFPRYVLARPSDLWTRTPCSTSSQAGGGAMASATHRAAS